MEEIERDLGPEGTIEFLERFKPGKGDYTAERHKILDRIDLSEVPALVAELRRDGRLPCVEDDNRES
ncbi:MAG TPA: hypothetical protein VF584_16960 [Longimicrobium sp.]